MLQIVQSKHLWVLSSLRFCQQVKLLLICILFSSLFQLYEIDDNPKRKEFLDELFSYMQKRGKSEVDITNTLPQIANVPAHRVWHQKVPYSFIHKIAPNSTIAHN